MRIRRIFGPMVVALMVGSLTLVASPVPAGAQGFVDDVIPASASSWDALLVDSADRFLVRTDVDATTLSLTRYPPSGEIDGSFGTGGTATVAVVNVAWTELTIAPGGSVLVADQPEGEQRFRLVTSAGDLDPTYGTDGELRFPSSGAVVLPDGALLVLDYGVPGSLPLSRFDAAGQLDGSYGIGGTTQVPCCSPPPGGPDYWLRPDADGGVLVIGSDGQEARGHRFDADGTLLASRVLDWTGYIWATHPDGSYLIHDAGRVLRRVRTDLTVDPAFGAYAPVVETGDVVSATVSGDRIYLAMSERVAGGSWTARIRAFDSEGPDLSFGQDGVVEFVVPGPGDGGRAVPSISVSPDGYGGVLVRRAVTYHSGPVFTEPHKAWLTQLAEDGRELKEWYHPYIGEVALPAADGAVVASVELIRTGSGGPHADAVRRFRPLDPRIAPFETIADFADRLALDFAGRSATAAEVAALEAAIADGVSASEVIRQAADDPYWSTRLDPMVRLYRAYFARLPDLGGLEHWMRRRDGGTSIARISAVFADSSEFRNTYGSLSNQEFVKLVYVNVLGRPGDQVGIDFWTRRLDRRRTSRGHLMASFSESSEHVRRLASEVATVSLYVGMLHRVPTVEELETWAGPEPIGDEDALARSLRGSDEYLGLL